MYVHCNGDVLYENHLLETIISQQRLRQGCPLSPYFFILAMEGLLALINKEMSTDNLHICKITQGAPILTLFLLLFFLANDCLLVLRAIDTNTIVIKSVLDLYDKEFGHIVYDHKSLAYFGNNTSSSAHHDFCATIGIHVTYVHGNYFELPIFIGQHKKDIFSFVKDKGEISASYQEMEM